MKKIKSSFFHGYQFSSVFIKPTSFLVTQISEIIIYILAVKVCIVSFRKKSQRPITVSFEKVSNLWGYAYSFIIKNRAATKILQHFYILFYTSMFVFYFCLIKKVSIWQPDNMCALQDSWRSLFFFSEHCGQILSKSAMLILETNVRDIE